MDTEQIVNFFSSYSLPSVIIALIICIISLVIDKTLKDKFPIEIRGYVPFILGVLFNAGYDFIFISHAITFPEQTVSAGLICGSLSTVFYSVIKKLLNGKNLGNILDVKLDPLYLSVEKILSEIISESDLNSIVNDVINVLNKDVTDDEKITEIAEILSKNVKEKADDNFVEIAKIIVISKNNIHSF